MDQLPALCLCLLICSGAAFSHQSGSKVTRLVVREDEDALLECAVDGRNIQGELFDWKKDGSIEVFFYTKGSDAGLSSQNPQFKNRVDHFPEQLAVGNASIVIKKAQVKDGGNYSCGFISSDRERRIQAQYELTVGAASKPSVTNLDQTKDGALLQCEVLGASPKPVVVWKDDSGNVIKSEEVEVTERGGSYDIILQTTVTQTDYYHCVVTQDDIKHQVSTKIKVFFGGAASEPSVTNLDQTKDWALLRCEVLGASPKPVVVWKDDSGNVIKCEEAEVTERGGSYDIILQTTVTQTDYYHCVVTQDDIKHQVSAKTHVVFGVSEFPIGLTVTAAVLGVLLVGIIVAGVFLRHKGYRCNKASQPSTSRSLNSPQLHDEEQVKEALTE